jgi:hypothetical protein
MDEVVGSQFERGLDAIKARAEAEPQDKNSNPHGR